MVDTTMHAMLFIPEPSDASTTIQRIPTMSLERIGLYIETLPIKKATTIKQKLSDSFTFNVALLPSDIRKHIVWYMFNANEKIAEEYYTTPLLHLCTELNNGRKIILNSKLPLKKQEKLATLLVGLPATQKTIINNVINPSFGTRLAYSGPVISEDTLATLDTTTANIFFKNQDIIQVQKFEEENPLSTYVFNCSALTLLLSACSAAGIHAMPFIACFLFNHCPDLSPTFSATSMATKLSALCWLAFISTTIRKRDRDKKIVLPT